MQRGEIMSAGQANVPQRKLLAGQSNSQLPASQNEAHVMDQYQANGVKKGNRGGSRGVPGQSNQ